jgi:concanavalin A-like lectin/glucanase superfamily protein
MRLRARGYRKIRRWRSLRVLTVSYVTVATVTLVAQPAGAAFTAASANPGNQLSAAATFPTYPQAVSADGPSFHHRQDDAAGSVTAADSSGNNRLGVYAAVTGAQTVWEFDENAGTTTADLAAVPGITGTLGGGATWTSSGHAGSGVNLNGSTALVTGSTSSVHTNQDFSVSAWVYLTDSVSTDTDTAVSEDPGSGSASGFYLGFSNGNWTFGMPETSASTTIQSAPCTGATTNTWAHLVGVYTSGSKQLQLYVNGALCTAALRSVAAQNWDATGSLVAGAGRYGGSGEASFWQGQLDDVRTYQRALTGNDVATLATGATNGPTTWYRFDENAGTAATDSSGNTNTGTFNGSAGWATGHSGSAFTVAAGQTGYVQATAPAVRTDQSFSVSAWVYLTDNSITRTAVSQPGTASSGFILKRDQYSNDWAFTTPRTDSSGATTDQVVSTAAAATNTWVFLVGVYDSTAQTINLYVNGSRQGTGVSKTVAWNATGALQIGRAQWNSGWVDQWAGSVDDVRLYPRALSGFEISTLYSGGNVGAMTMARTGALQGPQQGQQSSTAVAFDGLGNGYNPTQFTDPTSFTVECWFRVSPGVSGFLMGFSNLMTGGVGAFSRDRLVYIDTGGHVVFGVYPGSVVTVQSPNVYNDGQWHYLAASLGAAGQRLYLDGVLVASRTNTSAQNFTGYWRWGGLALGGWPNVTSACVSNPVACYLVGTMDEVAVYPTQLSDQHIAWHYHANH